MFWRMTAMRIWNIARSGMLLGAAVLMSCKSLDVPNPNDPSSAVLTDPTILESLAGGTMHTWFNSYSLLEVTGVMNVQARTLSSSWNNGNMKFYSGIDVVPADTTTDPTTWTRNTRSWQNDLSATGRTSVLDGWTGMYAALSSANSALNAIRVQNVSIGSPTQTKRAETVAQFMQGAALMWLALNFDQAYYVNEKTDLHAPINTTL